MTASEDVQDSFDESLTLGSQGRSQALKRHVHEVGPTLPCSKRNRSELAPRKQVEELPKFSGFLTAGSNSKVIVSEVALASVRARIRASEESHNKFESSGHQEAPPSFPSFVTAGSNKVIVVSASAIEAARQRLHSAAEVMEIGNNISGEAENRDPARTPLTRSASKSLLSSKISARAPTQSEFVSPLMETPRDVVSNFRFPSTKSEQTITPTMNRSHNGQSNLPPRRTSTTASTEVVGPCTSKGTFSTSTKPIITETAVERSVLSNRKTEVTISSTRITCVRDLKSCSTDTVDFLGIVVKGAVVDCSRSHGVPVIKVADRYGDSLLVELMSNSVPTNVSTGCVISVEGALVKRSEDYISLVVSESAFVDLEPSDPEAECLHRLFNTGLFDVPPSEEDFAFAGTSLRVIGRMSDYVNETSTVMARICSINYEALVYLGCSACRRYASRESDSLDTCQNCRNKKARYFYSLNVEIADFSGVVAVHFSDEAAERMIGKPAGALVKVPKSVLRIRLSPLYYRPMLFRLSMQSSRWFVDDWKYLDVAQFKPFLRNIAGQKGYK